MDDLYRDYILDHYKRPRNFGELEPRDLEAHDHNPLCGDELGVHIRVAEIGIPSRSRIQSASSSPTALTSIPTYSSEAIDAAAWEIAQPWPWKRRSAILPSSTRMCTPSSSPHSGL